MNNPSGIVGQTIGKYRVVEHLGRGGMAEVYKAYQPNLDRYVALKLMHAFLAADPDFIQRFEREAKNVAALRHPNIVQVYDFDIHEGMPFMVMEFIEGGTLKTYLENQSRQGLLLTTADAVRIVHEVGEALAYAHKRNMIHRDIKPANVMMDVGGRVILTDFGIAKILTGPSFTQTGATIGTPSYMSPEQSLGKPGDHRSDLYSLGVMLYQLSTGQLPYDADTPLAIMLKHVNEPLPMPRTFNPALSEGVERIILKSMAKNPEDRFQSAEEMLAQLHDLSGAANLNIPPASMAAGPEVHAPTIAAKTRLGSKTAIGSATPEIATTITKPAPTTKPFPWLAVGGGLGGLAVLIVLALVFGNVFGGGQTTATTSPLPATAVTETRATRVNTPAPGETQPSPTETPDVVATRFAGIELTSAVEKTQSAATLQAFVATATSTGTPNATQTAAACTYTYEITAQDPADAKILTVNSKTTKKLTLQNTGDCAFPAQSFVSETTSLSGLTPVALDISALAPNQTREVSFEWLGPRQSGILTRTFVVRLGDGRELDEAISLSFRYVIPFTPTPGRSPTPASAPASATPTRGTGITNIYPSAFFPCEYVNNGMDYRCQVQITVEGATGRVTLTYNGEQAGFYQPGQPIYVYIIGRRCNATPYTVGAVDDGTNSNYSRGLYFDPAGQGSLFPGGTCTLP